MNFGNVFGGRRNEGNDCCCSIIWLLFLLSICGNNGCGFGGHGDNDCFMIIILLLLICNCGDNNMGGCRG